MDATDPQDAVTDPRLYALGALVLILCFGKIASWLVYTVVYLVFVCCVATAFHAVLVWLGLVAPLEAGDVIMGEGGMLGVGVR